MLHDDRLKEELRRRLASGEGPEALLKEFEAANPDLTLNDILELRKASGQDSAEESGILLLDDTANESGQSSGGLAIFAEDHSVPSGDDSGGLNLETTELEDSGTALDISNESGDSELMASDIFDPDEVFEAGDLFEDSQPPQEHSAPVMALPQEEVHMGWNVAVGALAVLSTVCMAFTLSVVLQSL